MGNGSIAIFDWTGGSLTLQDTVGGVFTAQAHPLTGTPVDMVWATLVDNGDIPQRVVVYGSHLLDDLRGAEEYGVALISKLLTSGVGTLSCDCGVLHNLCFEHGEAEIVFGDDGSEVQYRLEYLWGTIEEVTAAAATDGTPGGGNTGSSMSWTLGGIEVGDLARLGRIAGQREIIYNHLPRGLGLRFATPPAFGATLILELLAQVEKPSRAEVLTYAEGLPVQIGTTAAILAGNGQSYTGCYLRAVRISEEDSTIGDLHIAVERGA